jgi:hypothetical protein
MKINIYLQNKLKTLNFMKFLFKKIFILYSKL